MAYTTSFLDTSYTIYANDREVIEKLRRELKALGSSEPVASEFLSQRSLLSDALNNLSKDISKKYDEIFTSSLVTAVKNILEDINGLSDEDAISYLEGDGLSDYNIVKAAIDGMAVTIDSLVVRTQDVVSSTGVLNESFKNTIKDVVLAGAAVKLGLSIASVGTWLVAGATASAVVIFVNGVLDLIVDISEEGILGGLESFWNNSVKGFFSDVFSTISTTATSIYRNFLAPVGQGFERFFEDPVNVSNRALSDLTEIVNQASASVIAQGIPQSLFNAARELVDRGIELLGDLGNTISDSWKDFLNRDGVRDTGFGNFLEDATQAASDFGSGILNFITGFISDQNTRNVIGAISNVLSIVAPNFEDGVTETRFGRAMENSWGTFLNEALSTASELGVNILPTTPLDPSFNQNYNLYGNMMLGAPLGYTRITDPNNRTMLNTFVKDSVFLSLTPGMPKYNGGAFQQEVLNLFSSGVGSSYLNQTPTAGEMRDYLFRNGLDEYFGNRDKRYYTFQTDYEEYFAYLETMLNTLWVKMGLGTNEDGSFDIFSFFDDGRESLSSRFRSSMGFFVNPVGDISEAISSSTLSTDLADDANAASSQFQRLNYITGMGTAGQGRNFMRQIGVASMQAGTLRDTLSKYIQVSGGNIFAKGLSLAKSVVDFSTQQDISSIVQQFQVTNGMKVQYPQLWESSSYVKNMNFTFNFVSPYGDPLSIFQYVYVPFFALLSFAMPRQAAENGLVSPFFVRADIPGWITSDLALVTDITWTRGGPDGTLWTKDKLPRAISGSFTVTDLYPYLAAVKRLSFLSANPSYTVFLDNMAGLRSLYNPNVNTDPFAEYWSTLINRVNGDKKDNNALFNRFNDDRKSTNANYSRTNRESISRTINKKSAPWLSKI